MMDLHDSVRAYDVTMTDTMYHPRQAETTLLMEMSDLATRAFSIGLFAFASLLFVLALNLN